MDILQAYEKNQPKAQAPSMAQRYTSDAGFFVRLVMKLSGGRIESTRQASWVLLGMSILILVLAVLIYNIVSPGTVVPIQSVTTSDVLPR